MGVFGFLRRKQLQVDQMQHPGSDPYNSIMMPRSRFNYKREVGDGRQNGIVMATLTWIARNFPEAPLVVYEQDAQGNWVIVPDHDLYPLLRRPNPYYSGTALWMASIMDFYLTGNAYWLKVRAAAGNVVELWWAPSSMMEPRWDDDGNNYITHYEYKPDPRARKGIELDPTDVVHFRYGLSAYNVRKGVSILDPVLREIFTDDEAANFSAALLRNMGVPGVVIIPQEGVRVSQEGAEEAKLQFMQRFGGDRRGEPLIMKAPVDIKKVSFTPEEMNLEAIRRIPEERISAIIGVPAVVVGLGAGLERSTYNNLAEAREIAYENAIIPPQRLMAAEVEVQLLPEFGPAENLRCGFDTSQVRVLQEDVNAVEKRLREGMLAGGIRRAEYRGALNLKVGPEDDVYLVPISVIEVGASDVSALTGTRGMEPPEIKGLSAKATRRDRQLVRAFNRDAARLSSLFADELSEAFVNIAEEVRQALLAEVRKQTPQPVRRAVVVAANGHKADDGGYDDPFGAPDYNDPFEDDDIPADWPDLYRRILRDPTAARQVLPEERIDEEMAAAYQSGYEEVVDSTFGLVERALNLEQPLGREDPRVQAVIRAGGTRRGLVDLSGQTIDAIRAGLEEARSEGLGPRETAKRIAEMVEGRNLYPGIWQRKYERELSRGVSEATARELATAAANRFRAETIARTETKHAQNVAAATAYELSEVVGACRVYDSDDCGWMSHDDPVKANGKIVSFDDARLYTLAHPRCVRNFAPVLKEEAETL